MGDNNKPRDVEVGASPPPPKDNLSAEVFKIASVITFYFIISLSMVFLNKVVMDNLQFPFPLLLTWLQFVVAIICIVVFGYLGKVGVSVFSIIPPWEFDMEIAKKVLPLTIVYLCMVVFNNLCLRYVQVSFYQVARSLTVLWTALFQRLFLGKSVSYIRVAAVCVVFSGFVVGSKGETMFDWGGLIFGVVASMFVALYGIFVKRVLPAVDNNEWRLLIYNTVMATVMLLPVVIVTGETEPLDPRYNSVAMSKDIWLAILLSGLAGFLINIAIFMQIKYTSPLTNAISGTVKAAVQTLLGVLLFGNLISLMNFFGIIMVIAGSFWYGQLSFAEMKAERAAQESVRK